MNQYDGLALVMEGSLWSFSLKFFVTIVHVIECGASASAQVNNFEDKRVSWQMAPSMLALDILQATTSNNVI